MNIRIRGPPVAYYDRKSYLKGGENMKKIVELLDYMKHSVSGEYPEILPPDSLGDDLAEMFNLPEPIRMAVLDILHFYCDMSGDEPTYL
jgi:hypothetical protein